MSDERACHEALGRLAHDVGKYVARIARNAPRGGALPPALHAMLLVDLYGGEGRPRPSTRFDDLSGGALLEAWGPPSPEEVRAWLTELDTLEPSVRAIEPAAVARAVELALSVADGISAWARAAAEETVRDH